MNYHSKTKEEIFKELETSEKGLKDNEAKKRLEKYGENAIAQKRKKSVIFLFLKQFNSPLIYILFAAMVISYVFDHIVDAYVILVIVLINAGIGLVEERKAERAIDALKRMIVSYAKVIREGQIVKVASKNLVPGDIICLEEGDKIPADARLFEIKDFRTQESSLTGESFPTEKNLKILDKSVTLSDRTNMVFMSTLVVSGTAKAVVVATSKQTAIGQVAESIQEIVQPKMHFSKKVNQLAFQMSIFAVIGSILVFVIGFFIRGMGFFEIFLFTIASLVSAIPEGLPAVLIVVLAVGARRMAKRNAVIRHLPAVETLGVATVIATDKTGTLTQNSMAVEKVVYSNGELDITGNGWEPVGRFISNKKPVNPLHMPLIKKILSISTLCNKGNLLRKEGNYDIVGDPTEVALLVLGKKAGLDKSNMQEKLVDDLAFNSDLKYRASLVKSGNTKQVYSLGAFETILNKSSYFFDGEKKLELDEKTKKEFFNKAEKLARKGMRVLGLAYRDVPNNTNSISKGLVTNLVFTCLVGMKDPPRKEVKESIEKARNAGIRIIMKTGDHKETAIAIAKEIGLVKGKSEALTEQELKKMSDEEFRDAVREVNIFARVTPKMKLKIIQTLQEQGEIVAMSGDGVNDAPALKSADIGIAMGITGTDVARESSEIILTDDNFASIVNAIEEGRTVFRNVKRTSFFLVTTNVAEQATIISAMAFTLPLPVLPIQVLYLNLVTDTLPAIALTLEQGHHDVLKKPPRDKNQRILNKDLIPFLVISVLLMTAGTIPLFNYFLVDGIDKARTVAFVSLSMFQLFNVFNMRSLKVSLFKLGVMGNKYVIGSVILSVVFMLGVIYLPWISGVFSFVPLSLGEFLLISLIASSIFIAGEIFKFFKYGNGKK